MLASTLIEQRLQGVPLNTLYRSIQENKQPVKPVSPKFDFCNSVLPQVITSVKELRAAVLKEDAAKLKTIVASLQETLLMMNDATE